MQRKAAVTKRRREDDLPAMQFATPLHGNPSVPAPPFQPPSRQVPPASPPQEGSRALTTANVASLATPRSQIMRRSDDVDTVPARSPVANPTPSVEYGARTPRHGNLFSRSVHNVDPDSERQAQQWAHQAAFFFSQIDKRPLNFAVVE